MQQKENTSCYNEFQCLLRSFKILCDFLHFYFISKNPPELVFSLYLLSFGSPEVSGSLRILIFEGPHVNLCMWGWAINRNHPPDVRQIHKMLSFDNFWPNHRICRIFETKKTKHSKHRGKQPCGGPERLIAYISKSSPPPIIISYYPLLSYSLYSLCSLDFLIFMGGTPLDSC